MNIKNRPDFKSIIPFLPPLTPSQSGKLSWPNTQFTKALETLSHGPCTTQNNPGEKLFNTITTLRGYLYSKPDRLAKSTGQGFSKFFDELLPKEASRRWFDDVVPSIAGLILRLPGLIESHYRDCDGIVDGVSTGLRLLEPQSPGVVFLSQELIAALLSCSLFCLFPTVKRKASLMRAINMDQLFASLHDKYQEKQKHKLMCLVHYFERIRSSTPSNFLSFERKVLSLGPNSPGVARPNSDFWANSSTPLCKFKVFRTGKIENHPAGSLEIIFGDEYIGGIVLTKGCLQEEIRFMMNPELIAGMLFLPRMSENESIEMVGAEKFSHYRGYQNSFQFVGDHVDKRKIGPFQRRMSRLISIDALRRAGTKQYKSEFLLREANKAFCGFLDHSKHLGYDSDAGIVTGNWGCGAFGGDPQIKSMIQWAAASEASRPFVSYYTFGNEKLQHLEQVIEWIVSQKWTVRDLCKSLWEYGSKRSNGETKLTYFSHLIPSLQEKASGSGSKRSKSGAGQGASQGGSKKASKRSSGS